MRNAELYFFILVVFACSVKGQYKTQKLSDCDIIVRSVYDCEDRGYMDFSIKLVSTDDDGGKAIDAVFNPDEALTAGHTFIGKLDQFKDGAWQNDAYNYDGEMCATESLYFPKVWKKLREQSNPKIENDCGDVEPGRFEFHNFEISPQDLDIPATMYGIFRMTIMLKNPEDDTAFCIISEVEVTDKARR